MLKCYIKIGRKSRIRTKGTIKEVVKDTAILIAVINKELNQKDPGMSSAYKDALLTLLQHPDSPVWKGE